MKKIIYLLILSLFVFTYCEQEDEIIDVTSVEGKTNLVEVCKYNTGLDIWETVSVPENSLKGQLNNPNIYEGPCKTYVPDDSFEGYLIWLGHDDVLDDYVLTSNINSLTSFSIPEEDGGGDAYGMEVFDIYDLTGIEGFENLVDFYMGTDHHVVNIDFSGNINLESVHLAGNFFLENINLSNSIDLEFLYIQDDHNLSNLDLTNNITLESLYIHGTQNTTLDLSNNINLTSLYISIPTLTSLNLKNGHNTFLSSVELYRMTNVPCIQVDNAAYSNANWTIYPVTATTIFSDDCG